MLDTDSRMKILESFHQGVCVAEANIVSLENELTEYPFIPYSPHPMIKLHPGQSQSCHLNRKSQETRAQIIRKIAMAQGELRIQKEGLDFYKSVRSASKEYMKEIEQMFIEKKSLHATLLDQHGMYFPAW